MGLFDFFKKKQQPKAKDTLYDLAQKTDETPSENKLEAILRLASQQPEYHREFYRMLLTEKLVIITDKHENRDDTTLEEGSNVNIVSFQNGAIPAFTSPERIYDGDFREEAAILHMKGKDLFELTVGATIILNPFSRYGKELVPEEIQMLLGRNMMHREIKVEEDTQVMIGQPTKYPTEIVEALRALYTGHPEVKKAYLGWIQDPASDDPPHYIFALDMENGRDEGIFNATGFTAYQFLPKDEFVDVVLIDDSPLSGYFTEKTQPFYTQT